MSSTIPQDIPLKQCSKCKEVKPATYEYFRPPRNICRACDKETGRLWYERQPKKYRYAKPDAKTKVCSKCHIEKPLHCFYPSKDGILKRYPQCILCKTPLKAENYTQGELPLIKRCHVCGKEKINDEFPGDTSRSGGYSDRCRECNTKQSRQYNQKNREQNRARDRLYSATHREERAIRARHRDIQKKQVKGSYTTAQIKEQHKRQQGLCYYCHKKVAWGKHHIDHTFPLSRVVGTDIPANDISYLVIACGPCNMSKHNKFPWEWPEGGRLL